MNQLNSKNIGNRSQHAGLQRRHCIALALSVAISGACGHAAASPTTSATTASAPILVLGDSLSAEYGLTRGKGWVKLLQQRLEAEKTPRKVVNASISGETTSGGRSRLPALLKQHAPGIVILELGGNDALRGLALQNTQQNLEAMVKAAKAANAQVLLVGMQVPPNYGASYTEQFAQLFKQVASAHQLPLVPFLLAGIGDGGGSANTEQWFQSDRIHPNTQAQPHMLGNVWPTLKTMLK